MASAVAVTNLGYWHVLRHNRNFRNLWIGQLISSAGDWFNNVAVLGLALNLTGNGLASGMVLLAGSLPFFLMIPVAGPVVDRYDRRKVMLVSNFFGALFALSFLLVHDSGGVWILFAGSALLITSAAFFNPAAQATVPNIVRQEELLSANALSSSTWGIMVMVGSALGGIVSQLVGRESVFILNAVSFLLANVFIWLVKAPAQHKEKRGEVASSRSAWSDFGEGLQYVRKHLPVMGLVAVKSGWNLAAGVLVLLAVFATQVFNEGDAGIGILYAGRGLGALAGPFLVKGFIGQNVERTRLVIGAGFAVSGIGYLLFAASANVGIWAGSLVLVFAHLGGGITWTLSSVLLQRAVIDRYRGRVFSLDLGMSTLTSSLSTLAWSFPLSWGASPVFLAVVGGAVFTGYCFIWTAITARGPFKISEEDEGYLDD